MPTHPLPVLINNGVQVALCSDDPSIFGNMGLSYDFFQVLKALFGKKSGGRAVLILMLGARCE
jgi:adenosine deaminase